MADELESVLERYIVQQLQRFGDREEIIREVCETANWNWDRAELFVEQVYRKHEPDLRKQKERISVPISVMFLIAGFSVLFLMYQLLWLPVQVRVMSQFSGEHVVQSELLANSLAMLLLVFPNTYIGLFLLLLFAFSAVGMIVGGIVGLYQAFSYLWSHK